MKKLLLIPTALIAAAFVAYGDGFEEVVNVLGDLPIAVGIERSYEPRCKAEWEAHVEDEDAVWEKYSELSSSIGEDGGGIKAWARNTGNTLCD